MPLYDCQCAVGHLFERAIPLAQFEEEIICSCGEPAQRRISSPRVLSGKVDYEYACPVTGQHISSKRQHEENLKRQGCRVLETGEHEFNQRRRAEADTELERKVDQTVERAIDTMPSEKREQLAKELTSGLTTTVTRT